MLSTLLADTTEERLVHPASRGLCPEREIVRTLTAAVSVMYYRLLIIFEHSAPLDLIIGLSFPLPSAS